MRFWAVARSASVMLLAASVSLHSQSGTSQAAMAAAPVATGRCASPKPVGSETDTVFATLSTDPTHEIPSGWEDMVLEGLAEHFRAPASLQVPIVGGTEHHSGDFRTVTTFIEGQVVATLHRTGRIDHATLAESSLSPDIDRQILAAVAELDSARILPAFPDGVKQKSVRIRFTVTEQPDENVRSRPLLVSQQPTWKLDSIGERKKPDFYLHYSEDAQFLSFGDTVIVDVAIDTIGAPMAGTVRFVRASHRLFEEAILGALPHTRFDAIRIAGCPVPYRQRLIFHFAHGPVAISPDWNWYW